MEALEVDASSGTEVAVRENSNCSALSEFEGIYRANVGVVTAYSARRCSPQTVADLTSETIVRPQRDLPALTPIAAPRACGCRGSRDTSTPSTAQIRRVAGPCPPPGQLPVQRGLAPVLPDLPRRHREPRRRQWSGSSFAGRRLGQARG